MQNEKKMNVADSSKIMLNMREMVMIKTISFAPIIAYFDEKPLWLLILKLFMLIKNNNACGQVSKLGSSHNVLYTEHVWK